jgi:hypothetical protein
MTWRGWVVIGAGVIVAGVGGMVLVVNRQAAAIDLEHPPQFIQAEFIELDKVGSISKFRGGEGHDFSGGGETCRSMKHYVKPIYDPTDPGAYPQGNGQTLPPPPTPETAIAIFSPVDGVLEDVSSEQTPIGQQLRIKPAHAPQFRIRLFHIYLDAGIGRGSKLVAGQRIGAIAKGSGTDIAIQAGPMPWQETFVSYFAVMPDQLFAAYQARGVASREALIVSRAERDAHPFSCDGEQFVYPDGYDHTADEVRLSGYVDGRYSRASQEVEEGAQTAHRSTSFTSEESPRQGGATSQVSPAGDTPSAEPPLGIKHLGIELAPYDAATGRAGDLAFTKAKLQFDRLFMGYGFVIPGGQTSSGADKANPQPTIIVPLGTKVRSLVDGVVVGVNPLYSGDVTVMVASDAKSPWIYELEHVVKPVVAVGDRVTAGQVVAEAANFNNNAPAGFGLFEIGILMGGNPPQHVCPFQYPDAAVKDQLLGQLTQLFKDWEVFKKDASLYDDAEPIPGCRTLDPING